MLARLDHVAADTLSALHRERIDEFASIRQLLQRLIDSAATLRAGVTKRGQEREARVVSVDDEKVILEVLSGTFAAGLQVFFTTEIAAVRYFFASTPIEVSGPSTVVIGFPKAVYRAERRGEPRQSGEGRWVTVLPPGSRPVAAQTIDISSRGASIGVSAIASLEIPDEFQLSQSSGDLSFARVRSRRTHGDQQLVRIGVSLSATPYDAEVAVEPRISILPDEHPAWGAIRQGGRTRGVDRERASELLRLQEVVRFHNNEGRWICARLDRTWRTGPSTPVVIVPPAWGSTKESSVGIAFTLTETFHAAGESVYVLRYDGTNRQGESYLPPENRSPGCEYLGFTFSGAARDLRAALSFSRSISSGPLIVVSASLAAVESRHVLAGDSAGVAGWLPMLGVADLRSALRAVSGGIDYAEGLRKGIRFGRHEILGVTVDMDTTGLDAIREGLAFEEDARREMAQVSIPVTWIHGRYDGWLDLYQVRETLSSGTGPKRRLIEVPAGHRLTDGRMALATYVLAAEEIAAMACGVETSGHCPTLGTLRELRELELARVRESAIDMRGFWKRYLTGRDGVGGMELLCGTASYRNFMSEQLSALDLSLGSRVADLGAGIGGFSAAVFEGGGELRVSIVELDYVREALHRSKARRASRTPSVSGQIVFNLDLLNHQSLPFSDRAFDSIIASLLLGYLQFPERLLDEIRRVLEPGGRLVLSALHRDADISLLYSDGLMEYATQEARESLLGPDADLFDKVVRDFLNDGVRLMQLEELGRVRFWERDELEFLLSHAGFVVEGVHASLGNPPQALIVSATRG